MTLDHFTLHFFTMLITKARDRSYAHPSHTPLFPKKCSERKISGEKFQCLLRKGKAWHRDYHHCQKDSKEATVSWVPGMG